MSVLPQAFRTIGIIGRVNNQGVKETLHALIHFLSTLPIKVVIDAETATSLTSSNFPTLSRNQLGEHCDLIIVVGGDGSLLHATHDIINCKAPLLGINRGSLGFLTDINPTELEKITAILKGDYLLEKRFLLTAQTRLQGKLLAQEDALNEVALIPDMIPHILEFEVYIDNQFVCSHNSDGLIVATPTGSTAYALSGGGPILHPQLDAIVLVPMFPHSLSSRPIVVDGNRQIKLVISRNNRTSPRISCDGRPCIDAPAGSEIDITKKSQPLHLIHPLDYNYYETLRSKLQWGKKLHYTE